MRDQNAVSFQIGGWATPCGSAMWRTCTPLLWLEGTCQAKGGPPDLTPGCKTCLEFAGERSGEESHAPWDPLLRKEPGPGQGASPCRYQVHGT